MSRIYVYSTLTGDHEYASHVMNDSGQAMSRVGVLIKGGAGIANDNLITTHGTVTEVSEAQLEQLRTDPVFVIHEQNGFVKVDNAKVDVEVAVADMARRDASAPMVPEAMKEGDLPMDDKPARGRPRK